MTDQLEGLELYDCRAFFKLHLVELAKLGLAATTEMNRNLMYALDELLSRMKIFEIFKVEHVLLFLITKFKIKVEKIVLREVFLSLTSWRSIVK